MSTAKREVPMWMGQPVRSSTTQGKDLPELIGRPGRARLVVLGVEVCGRWETQPFLSLLARAGTLLEAFPAEACGAGVAISVVGLDFLHGCTCCGDVSARAPRCERS